MPGDREEIEDVNVTAKVGVESDRPVDLHNFKISSKETGIRLRKGSDGSRVSSGVISSGGTGIHIGSDPLEAMIAEARSRHPALYRANDEDIAEVLRKLSEAPQEQQTATLRFSALGKFLAKNGPVDWANLALTLVSVWRS